ncbi:MAG TPA: hypothetical protein VIJ07_21300 [Dermatophilaceae bacterium]
MNGVWPPATYSPFFGPCFEGLGMNLPPPQARRFTWIPHNFFEPPKDVVDPKPDPNQDAIDALHPRRRPITAFIGLACSLAGLCALYFGRSAVPVAACLGAGGIVLSVIGWRFARKRRGPVGVALAGLLLGVAVAIIVILLSV